MRGKFIGETSMGFIHGQTYDVKSNIEPIGVKGKIQNCIVLRDNVSAAWCPYSSLEAVMKNWEFNFIRSVI